jgi:hypothetical protein
MTRCDSNSHARDVGGEEVNAVAVEVAAGAGVVLGGAGVGMPGQDLGIAQRHACVQGVGDGRGQDVWPVSAPLSPPPVGFAPRRIVRGCGSKPIGSSPGPPISLSPAAEQDRPRE